MAWCDTFLLKIYLAIYLSIYARRVNHASQRLPNVYLQRIPDVILRKVLPGLQPHLGDWRPGNEAS